MMRPAIHRWTGTGRSWACARGGESSAAIPVTIDTAQRSSLEPAGRPNFEALLIPETLCDIVSMVLPEKSSFETILLSRHAQSGASIVGNRAETARRINPLIRRKQRGRNVDACNSVLRFCRHASG